MKRTPLKRSTKPLKRTPVKPATKPLPVKRAKPRRVSVTRSQDYMDWLKTQRCVACRKMRRTPLEELTTCGAVDPCHTVNNGGSSKGPDSSCIPLGRKHHREMDGHLNTRITTKAAFASKYKLDLAAVALEHWNRYQLECGK